MTAAVALACWLLVQQLPVELSVAPEAPVVGEPVAVTARAAGAPAAGVTVTVVLPDGERAAIGVTDAAGGLAYTPRTAGQHTLVADVGGVRCLTPVFAQAAQRRWLLAVGSVPLGLALLWVQLRALRRRGAAARGGPDPPATPGPDRRGS